MKTIETIYGKISFADNDTDFLNKNPKLNETLDYYIKKSDNIIDVGANTGYYSIMCSSLNSNANIYSFEPKKNKFAILEHNMRQNSVQNVTILNNSLGDDNNKFDITLDSLYLLGCDLLRIGTTTNAKKIIEGGIQTINKYRPIIICKSPDLHLEKYEIKELNNDNYIAKPI